VRVGKNDSVWHLGDFGFGRASLEIAAQLNGRKRLVMGNHDMYPAAAYLEHFTRVCGVVEFKGAVLSHVPMHSSQLDRWYLNIHGHLHAAKLEDPRYFCVSAEQVNLTPISYDELQEQRRTVS
jgi:calcineurin-like phosphoesterase family protein